LNRRSSEGASKEMISHIGELIGNWTSHYKLEQALNPQLMQEEFVDYVPVPRRDVPVHRWKFASLPSKISTTSHWHFKIFDARRRSLLCRGRSGEVSGLIVKSAPAHGVPLVGSGRNHPFLLPAEAPDEDDEADPVADAPHENALIHCSTREVQGWRCSYRQNEPEKLAHSKVHSVLLRDRNSMQFCAGRLPPGQRKPTIMQMLAKAEKRSVQQKVTDKRKRVALNAFAADPNDPFAPTDDAPAEDNPAEDAVAAAAPTEE
jgi:hypothetical protein